MFVRPASEPATVDNVPRSGPPRLTTAAVAAIASLAPGVARADDARPLAARVESEWSRAGAHATTLPSRFLFDDESAFLSLPEPTDGAPCTHVAIVAARGTSFRARLEGASEDPLAPEAGGRATSVAGVLELHRCDPAKPVRGVHVTADAGRGTVEVVIGHSSRPLPALSVVLPERTGGPLPPTPDTGPLSPLSPPEKRADVADARARRDGAVAAARLGSRAGEEGMGAEPVELQPGCHRIEIFAKDPRTEKPGRRFRLDLDAELRDQTGERLIARDRTEAPDAKLEACVGEPTRAGLVFVGALPGSDVTITHSSWPLPARLPPLWGPEARGRMARAMFARHVALPEHDPVFIAQGTSGVTPFPVPVEIGGCYLAVAGVGHGVARSFALRASVGPRESTDERGAAEGAALVAFCVRSGERARIEVQARGQGLGYGVALFRVKSGAWEASP